MLKYDNWNRIDRTVPWVCVSHVASAQLKNISLVVLDEGMRNIELENEKVHQKRFLSS